MIKPIEKLEETLKAPFKPDPGYRYNSDHYDVDRKRLALWVGLAAILLPVVIFLFVITGITHFRDSISHYYYSVLLGDFFIIVLAFIGSFLIMFKGESKTESFWTTLAGWCAYGVAMFPTSGSGVEPGSSTSGRIFVNMENMPAEGPIRVSEPGISIENAFQFFEYSAILHFACAAALFAYLAYHSLFVFTRIKPEQRKSGGELTSVKTTRNQLYHTTGGVILVCMVAIACQSLWPEAWTKGNYTFIFEALALIAFGFAWLVKSKLFGYLEDRNA